MPRRNWFLAGFGMVLVIVGGVAETRGGLVVGAAAVVFGLGAWVVFSGSSFAEHVVDTEGESLDVEVFHEGVDSVPIIPNKISSPGV